MSEADRFFQATKKHPERYYVVHYSSQSLFDDGVEDGGLSPRITSIVVMHFATRQTLAFAIHNVAEELGIPKEEIHKRFSEVEREILERFYTFARDRREKYWVHWNMRNLVFGFEHLEHRYRVLTGKDSPHIPVEVRVNLNDILRLRYGSDFVPDPKMLNLMLKNGERDKRFLTGQEEADAFKSHDFIRMNSSTICKVEFFRYVIVLAQSGRLKTSSKGLLVAVDRLLDGRPARLAAFATTAVSLVAGIVTGLLWLVETIL